MAEQYKQILVQNVESVVPNSPSLILNNVSIEHSGWYTFAEIETKFFISKILDEDSVCIDIGANIGMYSLLFLQLAPSSKVIAFEPSSNFRFLNENIPSNLERRFEAFQIALGDTDGVVEEEIWESFGHKKVREKFHFSKLDTFLESKPLHKIDVIKIDTDGFEIQILRGAKNSLSKFRPLVIIESDPDRGSGQSSEAIKEIFKDLRYKRLGTLDGNNDIYIHKTQDKKKIKRSLISRGIIVQKSFLGGLASKSSVFHSNRISQKLRLTSALKNKFFFEGLFFTNGKPWNYAATSSVLDKDAQYIELSGLVIGTDSNLICISENIPTLFSLPLPIGLYSRVLIPIKNSNGAKNIRVIVRSGGREGKALFLGLKIVSIS